MELGPEVVKALAARGGEPGWLLDRRLEALARFESLPWPDPRSEEWRYSELADFSLDGFDAVPGRHPEVADRSSLPAEILEGVGGGELDGLSVQLDADVVLSELAPGVAEAGVVFAPLGRAAREHEDLVRDALGSAGVSESERKFAALSDALSSGGTFVYAPRGVTVSRPMQCIHWISRPGVSVFPRTVIVAEEGANVTCIDLYRSGPLDGGALCAGTVEIYAHPAAQVSYLGIQDWAQSVWHFNTQRAIVERDATVRMLAGTLGARFSRSVTESILSGPGASSEMLGVYFGSGTQHFDHRSLQRHLAPHTRSQLYYKGALKGRSRAVYTGLIHIAKEAQKTDAWQGNRNLILSEHAKADSVPYLEIEANDVRCGHGASVGPPDEDVLFYLESRGLARAEAERLLVKGFFQEVLDRVGVPWVRESLRLAVEAELEA